jgi:hypothetical protein
LPFVPATLLGRISGDGHWFSCQDIFEVHLPAYFFTESRSSSGKRFTFAVYVEGNEWCPEFAPDGSIIALERTRGIVEGTPCLVNIAGVIHVRKVYRVEGKLTKAQESYLRYFRLKPLDESSTSEEIIRSDRVSILGTVTSVWKSYTDDLNPEARRLKRLFMRMSDDLTPSGVFALKSCISKLSGWSFLAHELPKAITGSRAYTDSDGRVVIFTPRLLHSDRKTPVTVDRDEAESTFNYLDRQVRDVSFLSREDARCFIYRTLFTV